MADEADFADIITQQQVEGSLAEIRAEKPVLTAQGVCHSCGSAVHNPDALFCDKDCAEDFERAVQAAMRNSGTTRAAASLALSAAPQD